MRLVVTLIVGLALSSATRVMPPAAPRKVLVLKLDGNADPAERARLQGEVARLAHEDNVVVTMGDTTLAETASLVGCDPAAPACLESVRQTLGVDEIVYGTATVAPDHRVELDVHHLPPKDQHATVGPGESVSSRPKGPDKLVPVSVRRADDSRRPSITASATTRSPRSPAAASRS